jgi:hypothetical protein
MVQISESLRQELAEFNEHNPRISHAEWLYGIERITDEYLQSLGLRPHGSFFCSGIVTGAFQNHDDRSTERDDGTQQTALGTAGIYPG